MKYKLIAMDFDGTLLTDQRTVTEQTKKTLIQYRKCGYFIVGVTGRTLGGAKSVVDVSLFDYLILNNGAYLYHVKENVGEYIHSISKEVAFGITSIVEKDAMQIDYCSGTTYYTYKKKKNSQSDFIKYVDSLSEIKEEIAKINIFLKDQRLGCYYLNEINQKYAVHSFVMQDSNSSTRLLTVNPEGINKGITLEKLGKRLHIPLSQMIYFGDGLNDLEVMELVGCSVAMGNALDSVKQRANQITLSNNENGISFFLESFL